jgi:hypothetical protein
LALLAGIEPADIGIESPSLPSREKPFICI